MANKVEIQISATGTEQASGAFKTVKRDLDSIGTSSASAMNSASGLAGELLKTASAVVTLGAAVAAIQSTISYMAKLETSALGIASAFLVGGQYIDETTGKALKGQQALIAAQRESAQVIEQLKVANMQTTATLDELVKAYQITLPVAMAKGFNKQQVMDFTTAMVQAAGAIGLPFEQLGQEIRSMLSGEITSDSRLSQILGLRKADIDRYKGDAQGLFDFLMQRMEGFRIAGIAAQTTWDGLMSNTKDILMQAGGEALKPVFESVKYELGEIVKHIYTIDEKTKAVKWNPDFVDGITTTRETITAITAEVYRLSMLIDLAGGSMTAFGSISLKVAEVITRFMTIGQFGDSLKAGSEKMSAWNKMIEDRYKDSERALQALSNRSVGLDADGNPLAKAAAAVSYKVNPANPSTATTKDTAAKELAELKKYETARLASIAAYHDRLNALTKQQSQMELAALKARHEQGLIEERAYLSEVAALRILEAQKELQQLSDKNDTQFAALDKARRTSGQNSPQYSEELTKAEKTLEAFQLAIGKLQGAEQEGANALQNEAVKYALAIQDTMTKAFESQQALGDNQLRTAFDMNVQLLEQQGFMEEALRLRIEQENAELRLKGLATDGVMALKDQIDALRTIRAEEERRTALADKQAVTAIIAEADPNIQRLMALRAANKKEIDEERIKQRELLKIRDGANALTAAMRKQNDAEIKASDDRLTALAKQGTRDEFQAKTAIVTGYIDTYAGLLNNLAGAIDQSSRDGFESAKALNIATAVMDTASGIMKAFATLPTLAAVPAAAMIAATGALQISKIASTSFGGGASAPSAPGSFSGGSSGSGSAGSAIGSPTSSIHNTQSYDSLKRLADASDNASLAIGRVADGMTNLADLFSSGTMAGNSISMAPGLGKAVTELGGGVITKIKDSNMVNYAKWGSIIPGAGTIMGAIVGAIKDIFSSGPWVPQTGGIALGMNNGVMAGQEWTQYAQQGGLFGGVKNKFVMTGISADFIDSMNVEVDKIKSSLAHAAVALGTSVDFANVNVPGTGITTAGRSTEEVAADVQKYFVTVAGALAQNMEGLKEFTYYGENAFDAAIRLATALQSVNESLSTLGLTLINSTLEGANAAYKLQDVMGGASAFADQIATYTKSLFTETEQAAMKAANDQRLVTVAFGEMGLAAPTTKASFTALVKSLDLTTDRGRALFAAMMDVSETFGALIDQADQLNKLLTDSQQDLKVRTLRVKGLTAEADMMELIYQQQAELLDYQTKGLDVTALRIVQEQEFQAALKESARNIGDVMTALQTQITGQLSVLQVVQGWNTSEETLTPLQRLDNTRSAYVNDMNSGNLDAVGGSAQAYLDAARNYYGGGSQYQDILATLKSQLAALGGTTDTSVDGISKQISWLEAIQKAITDGDDKAFNELTALNKNGITNNGLLASYASAINTFTNTIMTAQQQEKEIARQKGIVAWAQGPAWEAHQAYDTNQTNIQTATTAYRNAIDPDLKFTNTDSWSYANRQRELATGAWEGWQQEKNRQLAAGNILGAAALDSTIAAAFAKIKPLQDIVDALDVIKTGKPLATLQGASQGLLETWQYYQTRFDSAWNWLHDAGVPGYAVGSPYIPHDMTATIHQGEMILDRRSADVLRQYGIPTSGAADNRETVAELKETNQRLAASIEILQAGFNALLNQGEEQNRDTRDLAQQSRLKAAA